MEQARDFAQENGMFLKEVSAKTGEGVEESINMLVDKIIELYKKMEEKRREEEE